MLHRLWFRAVVLGSLHFAEDCSDEVGWRVKNSRKFNYEGVSVSTSEENLWIMCALLLEVRVISHLRDCTPHTARKSTAL